MPPCHHTRSNRIMSLLNMIFVVSVPPALLVRYVDTTSSKSQSPSACEDKGCGGCCGASVPLNSGWALSAAKETAGSWSLQTRLACGWKSSCATSAAEEPEVFRFFFFFFLFFSSFCSSVSCSRNLQKVKNRRHGMHQHGVQTIYCTYFWINSMFSICNCLFSISSTLQTASFSKKTSQQEGVHLLKSVVTWIQSGPLLKQTFCAFVLNFFLQEASLLPTYCVSWINWINY